jgi:hypothetical protein
MSQSYVHGVNGLMMGEFLGKMASTSVNAPGVTSDPVPAALTSRLGFDFAGRPLARLTFGAFGRALPAPRPNSTYP